MALKNKTLVIVIVVIIVIAFVVWMCSSYMKKKPEKFTYANKMDNVGTLNSPSSYETVDGSYNDMTAHAFADIVPPAQKGQPNPTMGDIRRNRLEYIETDKLLPSISGRSITPFDVDVADPLTYSFSTMVPRVQLKDRQKIQGDFLRGDIPIKRRACLSLIDRSRYDESSLLLHGAFSDHTQALYNKYTGRGRLNLPISVVNEETILDSN